jgi:hypothetical protein
MVAQSGDLFSKVFPWLAVLIGAAIAGAIIIALVRRALRHPGDGDAGGFTLHDLRRMHGAGTLTDEEFARARDAMIAKVRGRSTDVGAGERSNPDRLDDTLAPNDREDAPGSG